MGGGGGGGAIRSFWGVVLETCQALLEFKARCQARGHHVLMTPPILSLYMYRAPLSSGYLIKTKRKNENIVYVI